MFIKFSLYVNGLPMRKHMTYPHARTLANRFLVGNVEIRPEREGSYGSTEIRRSAEKPRRYGVSLVGYITAN